MKPLGQHLLLDLFDCDAKMISSLQGVKASMLEAAERAQATVVQLVFHEFSPFGISGVGLAIAESHLAIHTWPEHRYAAVDIFTCGDVLEPEGGGAGTSPSCWGQPRSLGAVQLGVWTPEALTSMARSRNLPRSA